MTRRRCSPLALVAALALLAGLTGLSAAPTPAAAAATCSIEQLTATTGGGNFSNTDPDISRDGTVVAFESNRDYTSDNVDGNQEVFRLDRDTDAFRQLSDTTGGSFANRSPAVDADGSVVVFTSDRNVLGNTELNREVLRWVGGGVFSTLAAVTDTGAGVSNGGPTLTATGGTVAFASNGDLTGGNADLSEEIFRHQVGNATTTQVTDTTGPVSVGEPDFDDAGAVLAFASNAPIASNADASDEVFIHTFATGTTRALTNSPVSIESFTPVLNGNGRRIALVSTANFAGRNPDGSPDTFLRETTAATTTQLTPGPAGSFGSGGPDINTAGTRVVIESDADLVGDNADGGFEVYLRDFNATGAQVTQVTDLPVGDAGEVSIDGSGRHVVFSSTANPTGGNADGNREIFLATCSAPPAPLTCDGQLVTVNRARGQQPTAAADVIRGTAASDTVNAKAGDDRFCGAGGNDTFNGGGGRDRAFGDIGNDRLRGDAGDDLLDGQAGNDALTGGAGPDTCRGGPGTDTATTCTTRQSIP